MTASIAALLVMVAAMIAYVLQLSDLPTIPVIVLTGCLAVGAWAMVLFSRQRPAAVDGFIALFGDADIAAILTDHRGNIIGRNQRFSLLTPDTTSGLRQIGDVLDLTFIDGAAIVYRLANRALREGRASEAGSLAQDQRFFVIDVQRSTDRHLLWTLSLSEAPVEDPHRHATYGHAKIDQTGAVTGENQAFGALEPSHKTTIRDAALTALKTGESEFSTRLPDFGDVSGILFRLPADDGADLFITTSSTAVMVHDDSVTVFDDLPVALARLTSEGQIVAVNSAAGALLGEKAKPGANLCNLVEGLGRPFPARIAEAVAGASSGRADLVRGTDPLREMYLRIALRQIDIGDESALFAVISDATEMESKERQFVQSQKMQAVGQLAGGVAHDFNNLLTAILGHCDLIALRHSESDPDFDDLNQIRQNANRAAALVRQLLAFSRQQKLNPQACVLPEVLSELSHLLNRLLSARVTLKVDCETELWPVWLDAQQFEQVILNLVVNARDAMPDGGKITIQCANECVTREEKRDRAVIPVGDYVRITVADEGTGMDPDTRAKAFEPFFSTKPTGEGTGLGLSTAYGIIKQTGGFIFIDSEVGTGTSFTILIPRISAEQASMPDEGDAAARKTAVDLSGAGRILLVEDEAPVRAFATRALRLRGYEVIEAEHAEAALTILGDGDVDIDLIISDVVMPGLDGPTWVREARNSHPDLGVIFTSGYNEDVFRKGINGLENCSFLPKPFSLDELSSAVKRRFANAQSTDAEVIDG
ncbi:MAG: ATP-binding protein [Pseudomonadota bacterium]